MLSGIHDQIAPAERHRRTAEAGLGLKDRDPDTRLGQRDRCCDACQTTADYYGRRGRPRLGIRHDNPFDYVSLGLFTPGEAIPEVIDFGSTINERPSLSP
jgi:hypothetical protein